VHYMDVVVGQSGGCVSYYSASTSTWECSGIQSGQYTNSNIQPFGLWNETRMWDSELYSYAHTNFSWP